jgi:RNA chaperone Hfq
MECTAARLKKFKDNKVPVKVFITTGTMLKGVVRDFDDVSVILDECLVFRDKVVSITPQD